MKTPVSYDEVLVIVSSMAVFPAPWYVSGGWSLDLYMNRVTRSHEDLEIGVARGHQAEVRAYFAHCPVFKAVDHAWVPWDEGETLELPVFQIWRRTNRITSGSRGWAIRSSGAFSYYEIAVHRIKGGMLCPKTSGS